MIFEGAEVDPTTLARSTKRFPCWCGDTQAHRLWSNHYNRNGATNYLYSIVRCTNCGQVRTHPCPAGGETDALYQGYGRGRSDDDQEVRGWFVARVDDVRKLAPPPARVLDVGCSTGTFVAMLGEVGYQAEGLDVDEFSVERARARGLRVALGDLEHMTLDADSYDLIVMSHTLEHIPNSIQAIKAVSRILALGGVLLVYVPNFRSIAAHVMKNNWGFLVPNQHIWHFEPVTLRNLVARASQDRLPKLWFRTSTSLECGETGILWKTFTKTSLLRSAAALGLGDELTAAFRKERR